MHKDYLSGIMKLGNKRNTFGDILVFNNGADILTTKEMAKHFKNEISNLTRFKKAKIEELNLKSLRKPEIKFKNFTIIVNSLRLDLIVSKLIHTSRSLSTDFIRDKRVLINYEIEEEASKLIKEKDILVIRGKGKFEIEKIDGITSKGKTKILVKHYI